MLQELSEVNLVIRRSDVGGIKVEPKAVLPGREVRLVLDRDDVIAILDNLPGRNDTRLSRVKDVLENELRRERQVVFVDGPDEPDDRMTEELKRRFGQDTVIRHADLASGETGLPLALTLVEEEGATIFVAGSESAPLATALRMVGEFPLVVLIPKYEGCDKKGHRLFTRFLQPTGVWCNTTGLPAE